MIARDSGLSDWERAAFVVALSAFVFVMDLAAPNAGAAMLYVPIIAGVYGLRRNAVATCWAAAVLLAIAGACLGKASGDWQLVSSRAILVVVVSITAVAVTVVSTRERTLRAQALLDPLTGVLNRRCFLELSNKEEARNRRDDGNLAVMMIDVDHFKRINDTHGHLIGDAVLKGLADACATTLRPSDIVARYGGEEFVVSLPSTEQGEAVVVADRLRAAIASQVFQGASEPFSITVSIGVASCSKGTPLSEAIQLADEALYRAKHGGRNRVECAPPPVRERAKPQIAGARSAARAILVVDDDDDFRTVIAQWLRDHGYAVVTAGDAEDAMRQLESNRAIDLLITDIVMPGGLEGFELGKRAETIRPGIKLLYMSGYAVAQSIRAEEPPAGPLMQKPFRLAHLVETVETVLRH